jgi:predicted ATP-dependent serine protease
LHIQRTDALEKPLVQILDEQLVRERTLRSTVQALDDLTGGLHSSQVTLFDSDNGYVSSILHMLCIQAISQFDEEVVWIDGGNSIDPYAISSMCKRLRLDKREILSRVNVSRAFTAYQLVTLIDEKLEEQVERSAPSTVIVSSITDMFLDKDMKWMESHQLLRRCLENISGVTKEHEIITVLTNRAQSQLRPSPKLSTLLYEHADQIVQMRTKRDGVLFRLPKEDREIVFSPVPWNQMILDEFKGEDNIGKDSGHLPIGT